MFLLEDFFENRHPFSIPLRHREPASDEDVELQIVRELIVQQFRRGRELRRLFPLVDPSALPRSTLQPARWKWRRAFGVPWRELGEHIKKLELRTELAASTWRFSSTQNIHSRGLRAMDSSASISALSRGRSSSHDFAPFACRINASWKGSQFHAAVLVHWLGIEPSRCSIRTPMTQALLTFTAATERRRRHRHCFGCLCDQIVSPKTLTSYKQHTARFFSLVQCSRLSLPRDPATLDALLCAFIEQMWESGDPKVWACHTLSSLLHYFHGSPQAIFTQVCCTCAVPDILVLFSWWLWCVCCSLSFVFKPFWIEFGELNGECDVAE